MISEFISASLWGSLGCDWFCRVNKVTHPGQKAIKNLGPSSLVLGFTKVFVHCNQKNTCTLFVFLMDCFEGAAPGNCNVQMKCKMSTYCCVSEPPSAFNNPNPALEVILISDNDLTVYHKQDN